MIKRTQNKFVAIAMISVTLVLVALMVVLNTLNYARVDQEAEELLSFLAENGGRFPDEESGGPGGEPSGEMGASDEMSSDGNAGASDEMSSDGNAGASDEMSSDGDVSASDEMNASGDVSASGEMSAGSDTSASGEMGASGAMGASGEPGMGRGGERREVRRGFTMETPYETRYFSVTLAMDGTVLASDTAQIAAVSAAQAEEIARSLHAAGKTDGYYVNYKYTMQPVEDGVQYVFLDCTTDRTAAEDFLRTSLLVSLCGMGVFYLLVLMLSGWVIKPMAVSYEKQKEFITNAGHELKTPLTVIGSCTDVLELEQGENKWISGIRDQVARLGILTQELVALARMDERKVLEKEEFDLSAAIREELEQFRVSAEQRGLKLTLDIRPGILYRGNPASLRQLAAILGDNAVKYTAPAGEISFQLTKKGRKICLVGTNPAEGLEAGDQSRLFERFYRGDTSHSSETSGYGIGLSMAESIVASHGGKIEAHSENGDALVITVQL